MQKFEGPRLDHVLAEVRSAVGGQARIIGANRVRRGGVAGFFAREWCEVAVEVDVHRDVDLDLEPKVEPGTHRGDDVRSFAERLLEREEHSRAPGATTGRPRAAPARRSPGFVSGASQQLGAPTNGRGRREGAAHAPSRRPVRRRSTPGVRSSEVASPDASPPARVVAVLSADVASGVRRASATAAAIGPDDGLVVIATPHREVAHPSWLVVRSAEAAASRAARWRRSGRAAVLLVEVPPGLEGHYFARDVLAAVCPDDIQVVERVEPQSSVDATVARCVAAAQSFAGAAPARVEAQPSHEGRNGHG